MITTNRVVNIDGTFGGSVPLNKTHTTTQIVIAGRSVGILTVTGKSTGSDVYESFNPALTLDLSAERTATIDGFSLESLFVSPGTAGANFTVTVTQWS